MSKLTIKTPESSGFVVLTNGDFLINDYDGSDGTTSAPATIYRKYDGASGQLVTGSGALVVDVSSFSADVGFTVDGSTGVTCAPDGTLYFMVGEVDASGLFFDTQAIVQTKPNGEYLSSQVINSQGTEDIDVMIGQ